MNVNGQLKFASLEMKDVDPSSSLAGKVWYNSTTDLPKVDKHVSTGSLDNLVWAAAGPTVTRASGSFIADGFRRLGGETVVVTGSDLNNGTYTTLTVTDTVMTFTTAVVNDADDDSVIITKTSINNWFENEQWDHIVTINDATDLYNALSNTGNTYRTVFIPNGTYDLSSLATKYIPIGKYVRKIYGESRDGTIIKSDFVAAGHGLIDLVGTSYGEIKNLTLQHKTDGNAQVGIYKATQIFLIENIKILNFITGISNNFGGSDYGYIKDCYIKLTAGVTGASVAALYYVVGGENIYIDGSSVTGYFVYVDHCSLLKNVYVLMGQTNVTAGTRSSAFNMCFNLLNCKAEKLSNFATSVVHSLNGFYQCYCLSNCSVNFNYTTHAGGVNSFTITIYESCNALSNCYAYVAFAATGTGVARVLYGIDLCLAVTTCYFESSTSGLTNVYSVFQGGGIVSCHVNSNTGNNYFQTNASASNDYSGAATPSGNTNCDANEYPDNP